MRLLNAADLTFHEFEGSSIPPYAILSHRWEGEEVTYQEFRKRSFATERKTGFVKIQRCCKQALEDSIEFVWVDTCCIDKSSSAELSEAINSMYAWYKRSTICYVFLSDVYSSREHMDPFDLHWEGWCHKDPDLVSQVLKSQWWTRGWTLQELIAPRKIVFYVNDSPLWCEIGTRYTLLELVATRTGIERGILLGGDVMTCSVAQRMSWASERETTRTEDLAYSLLGIFGVHMPLLYGEGKKAFLRLQEEIMKSTDDQTLFAWQLGFESMKHDLCGPLAPHPSKFRGASNLLPVPDAEFQSPYSMTNKGLMLEVPIVHQGDDPYGVVILHCGTYNTRSGLPVVRLGPPGTNRYARDARYIGPLMTVAVQAHTPRIIFMNQEPGVRVERQRQIQVDVSPDALALFPIVYSDTSVYRVPNPLGPQGHSFHNSRRRGAILLSGPYYPHDLLVLSNIERQHVGRYACKVIHTGTEPEPTTDQLEIRHLAHELGNIFPWKEGVVSEYVDRVPSWSLNHGGYGPPNNRTSFAVLPQDLVVMAEFVPYHALDTGDHGDLVLKIHVLDHSKGPEALYEMNTTPDYEF